jgi:hypothetical protein
VSAPAYNKRQWFALVGRHGWRCAYCGNNLRQRYEAFPLEPEHELTKDHKTPICRGGQDTLENLLPCCLRCNRLKGDKTTAEFLHDRPVFQDLHTEKRPGSTGIVLTSRAGLPFEELDTPGLLRSLVEEQAKTSWAWRNPA